MEGDNFRIDEYGRVISITDLGADVTPCKKCGTLSVLMFNWCRKCREEYPEEFIEMNPVLRVFK